ncbi:hypothetical protein VTO42DRAFT_586 [Malbranchea cinnamomea]
MEEQQLTPNEQSLQSASPPSSSSCPDSATQDSQQATAPSRPNAAARHSKRLTLNFPISVQLPVQCQTPTEVSTPSNGAMRPLNTSWANSPHRSSTTSPSALTEPPWDGGAQLLTAIAAQERKVLELREELQKAEAELTALKKQWAMEEKGRKKTEIMHHAEALKPLRQTQLMSQRQEGNIGSDASERRSIDAARARMSIDLRRQNSLSRSSVESPNGSESGTSVSARGRTVFQSSRHTRTLSLLSSVSLPNQKPSAAQTGENGDLKRGSRYPRSATLPSMERNGGDAASQSTGTSVNTSQSEKGLWRKSLPPLARDPTAEALMRTGRQMVSDFREGLWTFVEDLRQATVGEDVSSRADRSAHGSQAMRRTSGRNATSSSASRERSTTSSKTDKATSNGSTRASSGNKSTATHQEISFWSEFGIDAPEQTSTAQSTGSDPDAQKNNEESSLLDFDDNWDDWETPQQQSQQKTHTPSSSSSTFPQRDQSPSTNVSSPRTSTSLTDIKAPQNEKTSDASKTKRDSIPWPALTNLHPSKLTRTASNLMAEWEKSLASPDERASRNTTPDPSKTGKTD